MRRHLISTIAALAAATASFGLLAGGALAKSVTKHKRAAPAVKATATLYLYDAFFVDHQTVDVPGRPMQVTGVVRPYVPNQKVTLTAYLGTKRISSHRLLVHPVKGGHSGEFIGTVVAPGHGTLRLEASHERSAKLQGFTVRRNVDALDPVTSSPLFATLVQQRLAKRHVYMPQSGRWDLQTSLAIDAYHRLLGRGTSQTLDGPTLTALLDGKGAFTVRYPKDGRHVEGDLGKQLLALIQGAKVQTIYPISSGKPSTPTILGRYRVYLRTPGYLPDGMYYSDFFIRGYAIHGYDPAPDYPASHGCMRLPISDAISVFDWLALGDVVDVYQ